MTKKYFVLETMDDISLSENHAKAFSSNSLNYIPGSAVLGSFASYFYNKQENLDSNEWFNILQNSNVKFSNFLPIKVNEDLIKDFYLPKPSSFHYKKISSRNVTDYVNKSSINYDSDEDVQLKQERTGFIKCSTSSKTDNKLYEYDISIKKNISTNTAINHKTQTAEEGKLYSIPSIAQGQYFLGFIEYNDVSLDEKISKYLEQKYVRIGKSRNNQYGRVKIRHLNDDFSYQLNEIKSCPEKDEKYYFYIWCLSDCEFWDLSLGMPTIFPQLNNLLLGVSQDVVKEFEKIEIKYEPSKSFIRSKNVRLFNRKRNGLDGEKQLVSQGSVICFQANKDVPLEILKEIEANGIGINKQLGYGQVMVNPMWITITSKDDFANAKFFNHIGNKKLKSDSVNENISDENSLLAWIKSKVKEDKRTLKYSSNAKDLLTAIKKIYLSARAYSAIPDEKDYGPNSSQWSSLKDIILNLSARNDETIEADKENYEKIKNYLDVRRDRGINVESWGARINADPTKKFSDEVFKKIKNEDVGVLREFFDIVISPNNDLSNYKNLKGDK